MLETVTARRADDAVISVQQDNTTQNITISGINVPALRLLGLDQDSVVLNSSLYSIVDSKTKNIISSYLEYSDNGTDLTDVVSKMRDFVLLNSQSQALSVKPKVFRVTSAKNFLNYEILIRDTSVSQKLSAFRRDMLPPDARYTIDENLGILDEQSTTTEVQVILSFAQRTAIEVVFAVVAPDPPFSDDTEAHGSMMRLLADSLSANLRYTDIVGYLGKSTLVFALLGCGRGNANAAATRIHGRVAEKLALLFSKATLSVVYASAHEAVDGALLSDMQHALLTYQRSRSSSVSPYKPDMVL